MNGIERLACMGAKASGARALRDDERSELGKERGALAGRALVMLLAAPVTLFASVFATAAAAHVLPKPWILVALLPMVAAIVGGAVLALAAVDALRRRGRIGRDLARGEAIAFEGYPRAQVTDRVRFVLAREGFPVDGGLSVAFEVLGATGRLWSVAGKRSRSWMLLPLETPAATPEHAARAAEWVKPVGSVGSATVLGRTRILSDDERKEIAGIEKRVLGVRVRRGLATAVCVAIVLRWTWLAHTHGVRAAGLLVVFLWTADYARRFAVDLRLLRRLATDREDGQVQIVRVRAKDSDVMSEPREILPRSRLAWSFAGEPAPWRRGSGARIGRG